MTILAAAGAPGRRAERRFYGTMAALVVAAVFVGFGPTYYLRPLWGPPAPLPRVLHVHGLVFSVWVALFVAQATLVAVHRVGWHRRLGYATAGWAVLMLPVGAWAALHVAGRATGPATEEARRFLAVQAFDLACSPRSWPRAS